MQSSHSPQIAALDANLVQLAKPIRVLKFLTWPNVLEERFLEGWRAGRPALPGVELKVPDWSAEIAALDELAARCSGDDPILQYLRRTALSYADAGRMLMAAGTAGFTDWSSRLYGRPDDAYRTQKFTGVDAAAFLLEKTDHLIEADYIAPTRPDMTAAQFAARLQQAIDAYFTDDKVEVRIDDDLSAKAIAGTTRIRIRASALFSDLDFDQLYQHEALIHTATALNGRRQPNLKSFALGAPRTTRTQEGIAVFAELATRSIDIARLRRLALRIQALKHALDGADFIDCFKIFLEAGQDEREAYKSAQRIFRGGDVRGGVAFTKDSAYLKGLMETHVAGRLTHSDTVTLGPYFDSGFLSRPRYVPPWAEDSRRLAALLAYSSFMMNVDLGALSLDAFVAAAERADEV
jgi:uncharacterized protein (TIGR02421 family)